MLRKTLEKQAILLYRDEDIKAGIGAAEISISLSLYYIDLTGFVLDVSVGEKLPPR